MKTIGLKRMKEIVMVLAELGFCENICVL